MSATEAPEEKKVYEPKVPQHMLDKEAEADKKIREGMGLEPEPAEPTPAPEPAAAAPEPQAPAPTPEPAPAPQPPPAAAVDTVAKAEHDELLQKYRTLQGRIEVQTGELKEAKGAVQALSAQYEELKARLPELPGHKKYLTDEEAEDFDPDVLDAAAKMAERVTKAEQERNDKRFKEQEERLNRESHARYVADLERYAPDWQTIDNDKGFNAWLDQTYPASDVVRRSILDAAVQKRDAAFIAGMIRQWKVDSGYKGPAAPAKPAPTGEQLVESQLQPVPGGAAPEPVVEQKPTMKQSEWNAHHDRCAKAYARNQTRLPDGKLVDELYQELSSIEREGRIVPG